MIPAILNARARRAASARERLIAAGGFEVREVGPERLADEARHAVINGARRIVVAGGDGSVGTIADALAGTDVEIGILPCGTLNHFARDLGIPLEIPAAVSTIQSGRAIAVDAAKVNSRLFLNTSAVGAYVAFIRARDRGEPFLGYHLSSIAAALRLLIHLPAFTVTLQVQGIERRYLTPLVLVANGERDLKVPLLGARVREGRSGLHVLVVRRRSGARALALALAAAARGISSVAETPAMDAFLVDRCRIEPPGHRIALDGEIVRMEPPLEYRHLPGHLRVIVNPGEVAPHGGTVHV